MKNTLKETPLQITKDIDFNKEYFVEERYNGYFYDLIGYFRIMTVSNAIAEMKQNLLNRFHFQDLYKDVSFETFDSVGNEVLVNKLKKITENGFKSGDKSISLVLWSKNIYGVGKTHLLYAMIKKYLVDDNNFKVSWVSENRVKVSYEALKVGIFTEYELLNKIKDAFKPDSEFSEGDVFEGFKKYGILCVDDLAKYTPSNLDFYQRVMFQLIDERCSSQKTLIMTTNKTPDALTEVLGYASADRLNDMTKNYRFEFKGQSHRGK